MIVLVAKSILMEQDNKMGSMNIREEVEKKLRALPEKSIERSSSLIVDHVRNLSLYTQAGIIASYVGVRGEIDPSALTRKPGPKIALPVTTKGEKLRFFIPDGPLIEGLFGVPQPASGQEVGIKELDLVLVPLVAVDKAGNRLGHGAGYYDRTFAFRKNTVHPPLVGLAHEFQVVKSIEPKPWDIPVDLLI